MYCRIAVALLGTLVLSGCITDETESPASPSIETTPESSSPPPPVGVRGNYQISKDAFDARLPDQAFYARLHIRFEPANATTESRSRAGTFFNRYAPSAQKAVLTASAALGGQSSSETPVLPTAILFNSDVGLPGDDGHTTTDVLSQGKYTPWVAVSPSSWMEVDLKLVTADQTRIDVFRNTVGQLSNIADRFADNTWIGGFGGDALRSASREADQALTGLVDPNGADRWTIEANDLRFSFTGKPSREVEVRLLDPEDRTLVLGRVRITVEITRTMLSPEPLAPSAFDELRPIDASARLRSQMAAYGGDAKPLAQTTQYQLLTTSFGSAQFSEAAATAACDRLRADASGLGLNTTDTALLIFEGMASVMDSDDQNRKRTLFRSACLSTSDRVRLKSLGREFVGPIPTPQLLNGDLNALGKYLTGQIDALPEAQAGLFETQLLLEYEQPIAATRDRALTDIRSEAPTGYACFVNGEGARGFWLRYEDGGEPRFRIAEFDIERPYGELIDTIRLRDPSQTERDRCEVQQPGFFSSAPRVARVSSPPADDPPVP